MAEAHPLSARTLFDLRGCVAVVTGGGTGIGLMIAQVFAVNGAKVYITGRRREVLEASAKAHGSPAALGNSGGSLVPLQMDVTSKDSIRRAVEEISKSNDYDSRLVNNAGIGSGRAAAKPEDGPEVYGKAMFDEDINDWQQVSLSNNTQIYFVSAAFVPLLSAAVKSPSHAPGNIINVSSQSGMTKWSQNSQYAYNCSKAAANHLTKMLAYELITPGISIRVNAICPGYFPSELTYGSSDATNKTNWPQEEYDAEMKKVGANVPTGRPGTDQEMAGAVLVLATNGYITGTCLAVDGGILLRHPACV
ncbi:uncharacterized protein PV07_12506 [Cladophialophora immunda]|uniref:Uncharacterized protein n=1 Tax=Cladophialophora immunda TaxID=569365 RepID=A0A0D2CEX1_9EURO|nr:uncharacterized protein PV07_12506 [Cladophialophora immunda]KIW22089.1 hypothetical protein PV07_12506 [Cladophialophora immunda]